LTPHRKKRTQEEHEKNKKWHDELDAMPEPMVIPYAGWTPEDDIHRKKFELWKRENPKYYNAMKRSSKLSAPNDFNDYDIEERVYYVWSECVEK